MIGAKEAVLFDLLYNKEYFHAQNIEIENPADYGLYIREYMDTKRLLDNKKAASPFVAWLQINPKVTALTDEALMECIQSGKINTMAYELVFWKKITEQQTEDYGTLIKGLYKGLFDEIPMDYYGQMTSFIGDVVLCGTSADDIKAFVITNSCFKTLKNFFDGKEDRLAKVLSGLDVMQEYNVLKAALAEEFISANKELQSKAEIRKDLLEASYALNKYNLRAAKDEGDIELPSVAKSSHEQNKPVSNKQHTYNNYPDDGYSGRFTDNEIALAKSTNMISFLSYRGYSFKKTGNSYSLNGNQYSSLKIDPRTNSWNRFSGKCNNYSGGSVIQFLMEFEGVTFREAVKELLDYQCYSRDNPVRPNIVSHDETPKQFDKKELQLPEKNENYKTLYAYLLKTRMISKWVVDFFVNSKVLYEDTHHNVVFLGTDVHGDPKNAFKRGTKTIGERYAVNASGSDKRYGFHLLQERDLIEGYEHPFKNELVIFEGEIDLMSYMSMYSDDTYLESWMPNLLACGGCKNVEAVFAFLDDHPNINRIRVIFDMDQAGRDGTDEIITKVNQKYGDKIFIEDGSYGCIRNSKHGCGADYKWEMHDVNDALIAYRQGKHPDMNADKYTEANYIEDVSARRV